MNTNILRQNKHKQIIKRTRAKIFGGEIRPRLAVFRSNRYIYAQIINDQGGKTIISVSEKELDGGKITKTDRARKLGNLIAQKALKNNIHSVIFDRRWYRYHGRIKAFAEGARSAGLVF